MSGRNAGGETTGAVIAELPQGADGLFIVPQQGVGVCYVQPETKRRRHRGPGARQPAGNRQYYRPGLILDHRALSGEC